MEHIYSTTVMLPSMAHPTSKGDDGRGGFDHEGGPPWDSVWNIHVQTFGSIHTVFVIIEGVFVKIPPSDTVF